MSYADLFEAIHSNKDVVYTPLAELNNKEYEDILNAVGLDINKVYKVEGKMHRFCYMDGMIYVEIYDMDYDYFIGFKVKEQIEYREKTYKKHIDNKNYSSLLALIDKPYRFDWYQKLYNDIPSEDRYDIFIDIYTCAEYGFNSLDREFVKKVFELRPKKEINIDSEVVTVYRGEGSKSAPYTEAYSWTTQYKTAEFFAHRFKDNGKIYKAKVKKEDIIDYLDCRGEAEVIVLPNSVYDIEQIK